MELYIISIRVYFYNISLYVHLSYYISSFKAMLLKESYKDDPIKTAETLWAVYSQAICFLSPVHGHDAVSLPSEPVHPRPGISRDTPKTRCPSRSPLPWTTSFRSVPPWQSPWQS